LRDFSFNPYAARVERDERFNSDMTMVKRSQCCDTDLCGTWYRRARSENRCPAKLLHLAPYCGK
jgi:hypothetical protein